MADLQTDLFTPAEFGATIGIAFKRLTRVDLPDAGSNQHELNGVTTLKALLGEDRIEHGPIRWIDAGSGDKESEPVDGRYTWYDAREHHKTRSEYRLYYSADNLLEGARAGDYLFVFLSERGPAPPLLALVVSAGSSEAEKLLRAFGIAGESQRLVVRSRQQLSTVLLELEVEELLRLLGTPITAAWRATPSLLDEVRRRFAGGFPSTREFSAFARESVGLPADGDPDELLVTWIDREEDAFRALEESLLRQRLAHGFPEVDDFVTLALSVLNRRKSRMGFALENHFRVILEARELAHSHNKITENNNRPDFVFPGIAEYRDPKFPPGQLTVLAAKSTCKERWNQILAEAERVPTKHLLTLDRDIPAGQLEKMRSSGVVLVVPQPLHRHYSAHQRNHFLTVREFLGRLRQP